MQSQFVEWWYASRVPTSAIFVEVCGDIFSVFVESHREFSNRLKDFVLKSWMSCEISTGWYLCWKLLSCHIVCSVYHIRLPTSRESVTCTIAVCAVSSRVKVTLAALASLTDCAAVAHLIISLNSLQSIEQFHALRESATSAVCSRRVRRC